MSLVSHFLQLLLLLLLVAGSLGSVNSGRGPSSASSSAFDAAKVRMSALRWGRREVPEKLQTPRVHQNTGTQLAHLPQLFAATFIREVAYTVGLLAGFEGLLRAVKKYVPEMYAAWKGKLPDNRKVCDRELVEAAELAVKEARGVGHGKVQLRVFHSDDVRACVFFGLLSPPTVALSRGLLEKWLPMKINAAIVLHEFGHVKHRHFASTLGFGCVLGAVIKVAQNLTQYDLRKKVEKRDNAIKEINDPNVLVLAPGAITFSKPSIFVVEALVGSLTFLAHYGKQFLSRRNELEADAYAGDALGENAMILALQAAQGVSPTLVKLQWYTGFIIPSALLWKTDEVMDSLQNLCGTHPSTAARIRVLMKRRDCKWVKYNKGDLVMEK